MRVGETQVVALEREPGKPPHGGALELRGIVDRIEPNERHRLSLTGHERMFARIRHERYRRQCGLHVVRNHPLVRAAQATRALIEHYSENTTPLARIAMGNPELAWPSASAKLGQGVVVVAPISEAAGERVVAVDSFVVE